MELGPLKHFRKLIDIPNWKLQSILSTKPPKIEKIYTFNKGLYIPKGLYIKKTYLEA